MLRKLSFSLLIILNACASRQVVIVPPSIPIIDESPSPITDQWLQNEHRGAHSYEDCFRGYLTPSGWIMYYVGEDCTLGYLIPGGWVVYPVKGWATYHETLPSVGYRLAHPDWREMGHTEKDPFK